MTVVMEEFAPELAESSSNDETGDSFDRARARKAAQEALQVIDRHAARHGVSRKDILHIVSRATSSEKEGPTTSRRRVNELPEKLRSPYLFDDDYTLHSQDDLSTIKEVLDQYITGFKGMQEEMVKIVVSESPLAGPWFACHGKNGSSRQGVENPGSVLIHEANYDYSPTALYKYVEERDWDAALIRVNMVPVEAKTWVYRQERQKHDPNGNILKTRWRILPLHAACIFSAPTYIIDAFITAYPDSPLMKDDRDKLPIHLACHAGVEKGVISSLLHSFPDAIGIKDGKGRLPLEVAMSSDSDKIEEMVNAIKTFGGYNTARKYF